MKSLKEKNMGITLVALVITIIILLILAGISIATLTGSGLFEKAREAREEWHNAQKDEEMQMEKYINEIDANIKNVKMLAEDISFTPTDVTWKAKDGTNITNVKQALDYFYDN